MEKLSSVRMVSSVLLVLMLLMATEMGPNPKVTEARTCLSKSHKFKGLCFSDTNCRSVCRTEGFYGGNCKGFRQRCFCTKHC